MCGMKAKKVYTMPDVLLVRVPHMRMMRGEDGPMVCRVPCREAEDEVAMHCMAVGEGGEGELKNFRWWDEGKKRMLIVCVCARAGVGGASLILKLRNKITGCQNCMAMGIEPVFSPDVQREAVDKLNDLYEKELAMLRKTVEGNPEKAEHVRVFSRKMTGDFVKDHEAVQKFNDKCVLGVNVLKSSGGVFVDRQVIGYYLKNPAAPYLTATPGDYGFEEMEMTGDTWLAIASSLIEAVLKDEEKKQEKKAEAKK